MKTVADPLLALCEGLPRIRTEYQVPAEFPPEVLVTAAAAAQRVPTQHADLTRVPFVTLDPASSTDLDQAFWIESSGSDLLLQYAIADVSWFVADGDEVDIEAWRRGTTLYLPDGKAGLYPPVLSEDAASLLPSGPRPAVVFTIRVSSNGTAVLDGAERATIRSRAKLAYDRVAPSELPKGFGELAQRVRAAEALRGTARIDPPEQEVTRDPNGGFKLVFKPRLQSEVDNATLSLAANLAIADALWSHRTGLFRVMDEPDEKAVARLRLNASALGVQWPHAMPLRAFERSLRPDLPRDAAMMMAIRRAGKGAEYAAYREGVRPWHAAMAAMYTHATAPLRRLADKYVIRAALEIANGRPVSATVTEAFRKLPPVMARADAMSSRVDRAVVDLAEAAMLVGAEGTVYDAVVLEASERSTKVQLDKLPVVTRVAITALEPGQAVKLNLVSVDMVGRLVAFEPV